MTVKDFFGKLFSPYLLGHLAAMALVVVALFLGLKLGLDVYPRHGKGIPVPNITGMDYRDALALLDQDGLLIAANDTGYNKRMPANCVLTQTPGAGTKVKEGRTIYVTVNSASSPKVALPDLIDNSSYREAQARLIAIGFRLLDPVRIDGERDWVYDIRSGGRSLQAGDMVSIESPLTLVVGNGLYEEEADESLTEDSTMADPLSEMEKGPDIDDFEKVMP